MEEKGGDQHLIPNDKLKIVYWIMFYIGLVGYLPWNMLITVSGYWDYKFRNVSLDNATDDSANELTDLQLTFASYLAIASHVPNAVFLILHAIFGHYINKRLRIVGSQVKP